MIIRGTIDAIASIGPIDGALMGASVAGPWGALAGLAFGITSQTVQFFYPDLKNSFKKKSYEAVDTVQDTGKSVLSKSENIVTSIGDDISKSMKDFTRNITEVGQSASKLQQSMKMTSPTLNWFG